VSQTLDVKSLPWVTRVRQSLERQWAAIDRSLLRLQGRVDTPAYDRWLPYGFAIAIATILIMLVLARHHSLDLGVETAKYAQATWQIGEGLRPDTTLAGGNIIAEQASLILYPLGALTSVLPRTETLLVVKALALALTVIPLWRLARRHGQLGIGATSAVVFAFSIYSSVHAMNAADFAPAVLAVPALMWAVLAGFDERKRTMTVAIIFVLCCRADLGLAIAGLGILLLIERRRRVGLIALGLGLGWFVLAIYGLQPFLGDGNFAFLAPYADFGETPLRIVGGIISHPVRFARLVGSLANFQVVVTLLAPVLFLPLTAPRYLMPAVPLYVLYTGADVPVGRLREASQAVPMAVFVFVATVFALRTTGRILVKRVRVERRIVLALLLTALVFFVRDSVTSPYNEPWQWGSRDQADSVRIDAVEELPDVDVPIRASAPFLPLLSERLGVYELDTTLPVGETLDRDTLDQVLDAATAQVDWVLWDRDAETLDGDLLDAFRTRMLERGWELFRREDEARIDIYKFTGVVETAPVIEGLVDPLIDQPEALELPNEPEG
jgi:uncharacterized membrane protein